MFLVCYGGDGPALPVEGAVFEIGDLRGEGWIDAKGEGGIEAESQVAEDSNLICAAVACEEGISRVGATIKSEVVDELFRELEPGGAGVGLFRILLVSVGGATGRLDFAGDDAEDGVGHARAVEGLLAGVVIKIVKRVLRCVIYLEIQGEGTQDYVCLFDGDAAVHACVFVDDTSASVPRDKDVRCDVGEC